MTPLEARLTELEASGADPALIRALRVAVAQRNQATQTIAALTFKDGAAAWTADDDAALLTALEGESK